MTERQASRRDFLAFLTALGAQASVTACRQTEESVVPQVRNSQPLTGSESLHFATALPFLDTALGVIVESRDARPVKVEGNPKHPESLGRTNSFAQATLYNLYDPDRSCGPKQQGTSRTWGEAQQMLSNWAKALDQSNGAKTAILTDCQRSPTMLAALAALRKQYPLLRVTTHEPLEQLNAREGASIAFGEAYEFLPNWGSAETVLILDGDPFGLEGGAVRAAHDWAVRPDAGDRRTNRLIVVESCLSLTGSIADHRFPCESRNILHLVSALALALVKQQAITASESLLGAFTKLVTVWGDAKWTKRIDVLAKELAEKRERSLIFVGMRQPPLVHALAYWLNSQLGNLEHSGAFWKSQPSETGGALALGQLATLLRDGQVEELLIIGTNPVFSAPGDVNFAGALKHAKRSVHLGEYYDETAQRCAWHLNLAHVLESFSDVTARDGTSSIIQPLIAPLWGSKTAAEVLMHLVGQNRSASDLVRDTWRTLLGADGFDVKFRQGLLNGTIGDAVGAVTVPAPDETRILAHFAHVDPIVPDALEVVFVPGHSTLDGRYANNGWLQELPCPITKVTWGNPAWVSADLARRLNLIDGRVVTIHANGRTQSFPVAVVPGQAANSITLTLGHGHEAFGKIANGIGNNAYVLCTEAHRFMASVDRLEVTATLAPLARTQTHFDDEGRRLARESTSGSPAAAATTGPGNDPQRALGPRSYEGRAWGMAIDLNRCTGCSTCVVACQVENNIPVVGKEGILRGRGMHWLRVDRYFSEHAEGVTTMAQPIPCQQCENAPCETVCPVGATAHSPEGLNDMVYNRCVGSRYCANNCPFKVRKFNYFEYGNPTDDLVKLRMNPDVTVRSRGVMEKCTFCVQRINDAKISAKLHGDSTIRDESFTTACAQACPTDAIVFGDLSDPSSRVSALRKSARSYELLAELGLMPRVTYLSKIRNPNSEM